MSRGGSSRELPEVIVLELLRHGLELRHRLLQIERGVLKPIDLRVLIDTSVVIASLLREEKERKRILLLADFFILVLKTGITLLLPSAVVTELWSCVCSWERLSPQEVGSRVQELVKNFRELPTRLLKILKQPVPLIAFQRSAELQLPIEYVPVTDADLVPYDRRLGFHDSVILNLARRLDAFLVVTETRPEFLRHAYTRGIRIVNPCSWSLAKYYYEELAPRYIKSQDPNVIVDWVRSRRKRMKLLAERYRDCIEEIK